MLNGDADKRQPLLSAEEKRALAEEASAAASSADDPTRGAAAGANAAEIAGAVGAVGAEGAAVSADVAADAGGASAGDGCVGAPSAGVGGSSASRTISRATASPSARGRNDRSGTRWRRAAGTPGASQGSRGGISPRGVSPARSAHMSAAISELRAASATMSRSQTVLSSPQGSSAAGSPGARALLTPSPSSPGNFGSVDVSEVGGGFGAAVTAAAGALRRELLERPRAAQEFSLASGGSTPCTPSPRSPWEGDASPSGAGGAEQPADCAEGAPSSLASAADSTRSRRSADAAAGARRAEPEAVVTPRSELTEVTGDSGFEGNDELLLNVAPSAPITLSAATDGALPEANGGARGSPAVAGEDLQELDIVQMTSEVFFVADNEGKINLDVMRLGTLEGTCKVNFKTVDCSARAGDAFGGKSGTITFRSGEHTKQIKIVIYSDDIWTGTQEFKVELSDPQQCNLGQYLYFARVQIMDTATFPSNRHRDQILGGPESMRTVSGVAFFKDYCSMVLQEERTRMRFAACLLMSQSEGLYVALTLYINIYITDVVLKQDDENLPELWLHDGPYDGRAYTAVFLGFLYFAPMLIIHIFAYISASIDLGGQTRELLQKGLFRMYLDYSANSRAKVTSSDIQVGILHNCAEAAEGFMLFMEVISLSMKLLILVYFVLQENPRALMVAGFMPVFMAIWIALRVSVLERRNKETKKMTAHVMRFVTSVCDHFQLIAGFRQRPQVCEMLSEHLEEAGRAQLNLEITELNNEYFSKWLGPLCTGIYIAFWAPRVLSGALNIGIYLATIRVFKELSEVFSEIYSALVKMIASIGSLKALLILFNMPTDLIQKQHNLRKIREMSRMERLKAFSGNNVTAERLELKYRPRDSNRRIFRTDLIEFKLWGVSFKYTTAPRVDVVLNNVTVSWPQGSLVAIVGAHGSGKSTLMDIIGGRLFASQGEVFCPAHLRVLLINADPVLLSVSLWKNLTFGRGEACHRRVWEILEGLGANRALRILWDDLQAMKLDGDVADLAKARGFPMPGEDGESQASLSDDDEADVDFIEGDASHKHSAWCSTMSASELQKLHLARALVVNSEVLVLHRPLDKYDDKTALCVLGAIQEHIQTRGYKVDPSGALERRPRTVVFTPSQKSQACTADIIWRLKNKCVERISAETLQKTRVSIS
eukprot:TRINITY_DN11529_c0_g6_i1.p1 TRINITY_DN11529_c0_g6~~TRINITY_DN11529_c0_g6_i1.p1  ORF type:complete len:1170 (+),score=263.40 TRINITY_DN11529_c0_g6_i1:1319-4828(+)